MTVSHQRSRLPIHLLLVVFALLVLLHTWATPLFEAPDEVWHYAYVRWLVEARDLPPMDSDVSGAGQEVAQPPLYYAVAALFSAPFPDDDLESFRWHNPNFGYQAPGTVPDNKNMLIHTARERFPWRGAALAVHVTRLASLLCGAVTVTASWGLGREAFGTRRGALLTAALVAFQPQFVFISSVVNNDSAAAALAAVALWLTARGLRRGVTHRRTLLTSAVVGLAALTKTSVLLLVPLVGAALLWKRWREQPSWRSLLTTGAIYTAAVITTGGWWYLRNYVLYGDPLGLTSHLETLWGRAAPVSLLQLLPEIPLLVRSFWGAYGWGHVFWPDAVYILLTVVALAFALSALLQLINSSGRSASDRTTLTLALALAWFALISAALLRWMQQVEAPHGRLLFPALSAWALLTAAGMRRRPRGHWANRAFLLALASLTTLAPGARLLATFAPPRLAAPEVAAKGLTPADLTYGGSARLLGVEVEPARLSPGESLAVTACWEGLQPMEEDYAIFVQVLGPEDVQIAARRTYPGLGRFPTSLWPVGRAFCDTYRTTVAPWAEAPLRYHVEVGLFDLESTARLPIRDAQGHPVEIPVVAQVVVEPPATERTAEDGAPLAQLGESVALQHYAAPPSVRAGGTLTVTLHWRALASPTDDLTAFVHLWEPGATAPVAQSDAPPRGGWYPTSVWQTDDCVPDIHRLPVPSDLAPGRYPLWAGMYRPEDGTRLPAHGPEGRYPHDLIPLGEVVVE